MHVEDSILIIESGLQYANWNEAPSFIVTAHGSRCQPAPVFSCNEGLNGGGSYAAAGRWESPLIFLYIPTNTRNREQTQEDTQKQTELSKLVVRWVIESACVLTISTLSRSVVHWLNSIRPGGGIPHLQIQREVRRQSSREVKVCWRVLLITLAVDLKRRRVGHQGASGTSAGASIFYPPKPCQREALL